MIIFTGEAVSNFEFTNGASADLLMSCTKRNCSWTHENWGASLHDWCEAAEEHRKECKP
jgi:hypothetical protein